MRSLLRKELRQLLPVCALVAVAAGIGLVFLPLASRLDELSWMSVVEVLGPDGSRTAGLLWLILALVTAYSLFPREYDERTIELLHSLPIRRRDIFVAKLLAAAIVLLGGLGLEMSVGAMLSSFNTQSLSGAQFQWPNLLTVYLLGGAYCLVVLSHGVLLSFFRRFGLVLYGIFWWAVTSSDAINAGIDPMRLLKLDYFGRTVLIPWPTLGAHVAAAAVLLVVSYVLWTYPAEMAAVLYRRLFSRVWGRVALGAGSLAIAGLSISFAVAMADGEVAKPRVVFNSLLPATFKTRHYRFAYPPALRRRAMPLMQGADAVYDTVRELLGSDSTPGVAVDLNEQSTEHAGLAGWKKIRMDIRGGRRNESYLRTLAHETTHVFEAVESNRRDMAADSSVHFFREGLAEYIGYRVVPDAKALRRRRLIGAVTWQRLDIRFEDLVDLRRFRGNYDEDSFYVVGESWVQALAQTCGESALGGVLRAVGQPDFPKEIEGTVLWQYALQQIGCDLEATNDAWMRAMRALLARESDAERIPRLSGGVFGQQDAAIVLVAYLDRSIEHLAPSFIVRVRNDAEDPPERVAVFAGSLREESHAGEVEFRVPRKVIEGDRFEFQFGCRLARGTPYFVERWQAGDVP